jgi:hypothetical protein
MHIFPKSVLYAQLGQAENFCTALGKADAPGNIPFLNYLKSHRQTMC